MPGLLLMLPITIFIAFIFLYFFFWSVKNGDFDDLELSANKMLQDDDTPPIVSSTELKEERISHQQREYTFMEESIPLNEKGYKVEEFYIAGIHCASCVMQIQQFFKNYNGLKSLFINSANSRSIIEWDSNVVSLWKIAADMASLGYSIQTIEHKTSNLRSKTILKQMTVAGFFTSSNMVLSTSLYIGFFSGIDTGTKQMFHILSWLFATPVLLYSARDIILNAWKATKNKFLGMDTLVAIGLLLAYFYSAYIVVTKQGEAFFDAVCFVTFVILIGRFLQEKIKERFTIMQDNLSRKLPKFVMVKKLGQEEGSPKDIRTIQPGDICFITPGEMIPVDGVLLSEYAEIDESIITGESKTIFKKQGDSIIAGSFSVVSTIEVRASVFSSETTVSIIQKLSQKSLTLVQTIQDLPILQWVYRSFTMVVLLCALSAFVYWKFYVGISYGDTFKIAIALLIVACPCSIALAIPTAIVAALRSAFSKGILIKNETVLHYLTGADTIIFDKTGTLTKGLMVIQDTVILEQDNAKEVLLEIASKISLQAKIKHPISVAFKKYNSYHTLKESFRKSKYIPGFGIECEQGDLLYYLGSKELMLNQGFVVDLSLNHDNTEVFLATYNRSTGVKTILCIFLLEDEIREEAYSIVQQLQKRQKRIILLTGDTEATAKKVALALGISEYYYSSTPQKKKILIQSLKEKQIGKIIMIGDGMNDAPSLAEADIGMSFIHSSEISVSAGDILFVGRDLPNLLYLFDLANKTKSIIYQNLLFSVLYNLIFIPLAFYGLIIPLIGAISMSVSSLLVLLNSLRIRSR